jgi:hypothetical protein
MTTAVVFPGIPGLAVRVGRSLERWGERAAQPADEAELTDRAYRAWRRDALVAASSEHDALARNSVLRLF